MPQDPIPSVSEHSPAFQIRPAGPGDAASLARIEEICFDPTLYGSPVPLRYFEYLLTNHRARILLAEQDGVAAGYAFVVFLHRCAATWFNSLAVTPPFQGKGVAKVLFKQAETAAVAAGCPYMILEVREDNRALRWRYGRGGYQLLGIKPGYYADGCAAVRMFKNLPPA